MDAARRRRNGPGRRSHRTRLHAGWVRRAAAWHAGDHRQRDVAGVRPGRAAPAAVPDVQAVQVVPGEHGGVSGGEAEGSCDFGD